MKIREGKFYYYDDNGEEQWIQPASHVLNFWIIDEYHIVLETDCGFYWFADYRDSNQSRITKLNR